MKIERKWVEKEIREADNEVRYGLNHDSTWWDGYAAAMRVVMERLDSKKKKRR